MNAARLQFINTELDLAFTFISIAKDAGLDADKTERNWKYARIAYETVTRLLTDAELSPAESSAIQPKLQQIKSALDQVEVVEEPDSAVS